MPVQPRLADPELRRHLGGVTPIPILPFKTDGSIDYVAHAKNVKYLIDNNHLEGGLERVVAIGGTSLICQVDPLELTKVMDATGRAMGDRGVLVAGVPPIMPLAHRLIAEQLALPRPPDAFLMMPLEGYYRTDGLYDTYMQFAERHGPNGGRFISYMRHTPDRDAFIRLLQESEYFQAVKLGSGHDDIAYMAEAVGPERSVVWGMGDLGSSEAAKRGARGHTSGVGMFAICLSDALNNAYRREDYAAAAALEDKFRPFEKIRGDMGYGYAAFCEAFALGGFDDTDGGVGHSLNPRVSPEIASMIKASLEPLLPYHNN